MGKKSRAWFKVGLVWLIVDLSMDGHLLSFRTIIIYYFVKYYRRLEVSFHSRARRSVEEIKSVLLVWFW
jgi:hypothetical protein